MAVGDLAFAFGGDAGAQTPEELAKRRAIAEALAGRVFGAAPQNVGEGLSAIGQALALRSMNARNARAETAGRESASSAFAPIVAALGGGGFPSAPAAPGGGSVASGTSASVPNPNVGSTIDFARAGPESYRNAIASIESAGSGDYAAIGPTHSKMGRALGRYQIMEANIGPWSREVLGTEVTPEQFMADPKIQDAIFDGKFGGYVQRFGPEGAAQAWFAGPGGVGKTGRKDVLGTDVGSYGQRFMSALGGSAPQPPAVAANEAMATGTQVASLDPSIGLPGQAEIDYFGEVPTSQASHSGTVYPGEQPGTHTMPDGSIMADAEMAPMVGGQPVSGPGAQLLTIPQPITGPNSPAMPLMPGAQAPAPQPAPVQTAQAEPMSEMAGNAPDMRGSAGPSLPQLLQAAQNPWLSDGQRSIINALIGQQMERNDPMRQMEMERAQLELEALRNPVGDPFNLSPGEIRYDAQGNVIARGGEKPRELPTDVQEYEYAKGQGFEGSFVDFQLAQKKAGATSVTTNVGGGDKFYEELDKSQAGIFSGLSEAGVQGRSKLAQIDRLEGLLAQAETGGLAMIKQAAGEYGINTEGLSDIQAAQALINELVPQQRQPGSGPMSDADLALFKQSLPRLINQPGGNQMVIDTMRGITQYQIQMGEIADAVADRAMTPTEARKAIRELPNPLEGFGKPKKVEIDGYTIEEVE